MAERNLRLAYAQARSAAVQAVATALAFIAAAIAALIAIIAAVYAKRAAEHTERGADAAHEALLDARADAEVQTARFARQLKVAQDAVLATDRAWVAVEAVIDGPLVFDENRVSVDMTVTCRNIGHSPAVAVLWHVEMVGNAADAEAAVENRKEFVGLRRALSLGEVLFPGEFREVECRPFLSQTEFAASCRMAVEIGLDKGDVAPLAEAWPTVLVGVEYQLPGDRAPRYTYRVYYVGRADIPRRGFDGAIGCFEVHQIALKPDEITGPIT